MDGRFQVILSLDSFGSMGSNQVGFGGPKAVLQQLHYGHILSDSASINAVRR